MASITTVDIPVPLYVEKYLAKRYGNDHKVSNTSLIGIMVIEISTKYYIKPVKGVPKCDGVFSMPVTEYYFNQKVFRIQRKKLQKLTKLLVRLFYEDMVQSINRDVATGSQPTARQSLKTFLQYYGITEGNLKMDTAYMEYQRKSGKKVKELKKQIA